MRPQSLFGDRTPKHAPGNDNAFSARALAENVLVPLSAELGISLGVTGRQPLNNQPYFRCRCR
jgi:hypothetical protein